MNIRTTEDYEALRELARLLHTLDIDNNIFDNVVFTYGGNFEECQDCGFVLNECQCDSDRAGFSSIYDDDVSFEQE